MSLKIPTLTCLQTCCRSIQRLRPSRPSPVWWPPIDRAAGPARPRLHQAPPGPELLHQQQAERQQVQAGPLPQSPSRSCRMPQGGLALLSKGSAAAAAQHRRLGVQRASLLGPGPPCWAHTRKQQGPLRRWLLLPEQPQQLLQAPSHPGSDPPQPPLKSSTFCRTARKRIMMAARSTDPPALLAARSGTPLGRAAF